MTISACLMSEKQQDKAFKEATRVLFVNMDQQIVQLIGQVHELRKEVAFFKFRYACLLSAQEEKRLDEPENV